MDVDDAVPAAGGGPGAGPDTREGDLALLRAYEPVIRYTAGELFLPTAVDAYVARAGLWRRRPGERRDECLAQSGELTLERLAAEGERFAADGLYLRLVDRPMDGAEYRRWRREGAQPSFRPSSRFAAVGLFARLVDAGLRLSILLRGTLPGGTRAAAHRLYVTHMQPNDHPYYARVSRDGGYVALQYWYFYPMNDWRSTFSGINDHEADWEQVTIFLGETLTGSLRPAWVAFSAHDEVGDDLRRRWDDPDIEFVGTHPVVYAGAGSHAGAYLPGEYVTTVALTWPNRLAAALRQMARTVLPWARDMPETIAGIPFIDYHRGDGPGIGAGERRAWHPVLIDDDTPWIRAYRGLWGLDTRDHFGGERAPAGPRYERDGAVRPGWANPVAWAGLDEEYPTAEHGAVLRESRASWLERRLAEIAVEIDVHRRTSRELRASDRARAAYTSHAGADKTRRRDRTGYGRDGRETIAWLHTEQTALREELDAIVRARTQPPIEAPHAHLRRRALPLAADAPRRRFLAIWSAASVSVMLAGVALVVISPPIGVLWSFAGLMALMLAIEAAARGRLVRFAATMAVAGAVVFAVLGAVEVVVRNWRAGAAAVLILASCVLLVGNLRAWMTTR
ncbi:hypothetical protein GCM10022255_003170 [Dactylosporangium darangshiense]|uniref:Uncharacterized protein n=3 Tax=Dactylosporangium darangshiense TaxID=579108 RepID=A0ABP8CUL6_9ACTN